MSQTYDEIKRDPKIAAQMRRHPGIPVHVAGAWAENLEDPERIARDRRDAKRGTERNPTLLRQRIFHHIDPGKAFKGIVGAPATRGQKHGDKTPFVPVVTRGGKTGANSKVVMVARATLEANRRRKLEIRRMREGARKRKAQRQARKRQRGR